MQTDKTPYKESMPCCPFNIMNKCSIESMNLVDMPGVRAALGSEQHVVLVSLDDVGVLVCWVRFQHNSLTMSNPQEWRQTCLSLVCVYSTYMESRVS